MTKEELIKMVRESSAEQSLTDMLIRWIETAYDCGFAEGVNMATKLQSEAYKLLFDENS